MLDLQEEGSWKKAERQKERERHRGKSEWPRERREEEGREGGGEKGGEGSREEWREVGMGVAAVAGTCCDVGPQVTGAAQGSQQCSPTVPRTKDGITRCSVWE